MQRIGCESPLEEGADRRRVGWDVRQDTESRLPLAPCQPFYFRGGKGVGVGRSVAVVVYKYMYLVRYKKQLERSRILHNYSTTNGNETS